MIDIMMVAHAAALLEERKQLKAQINAMPLELRAKALEEMHNRLPRRQPSPAAKEPQTGGFLLGLFFGWLL